MAAGGRWWGVGGAGGTAAAGAFAPFGGHFRDRGAGVLCFVLAHSSHAVGRKTVRCGADARRRSGGDVRGPGSGSRGWRAVGMCAVPARAGWGRGRIGAYVAGFRKGAAAAGIRDGGSRVGGRMLVGR